MSFSLTLVRSIFKNLGPYSASRLQVKRNYILVKETYTRQPVIQKSHAPNMVSFISVYDHVLSQKL